MLDASHPDYRRIVDLLQHQEYAYLITIRPDGRPHAVPVCFLWEHSTILIFSTADAVKVRNLRQNPRVALALDNFGRDDYFSVVVEGTAELLDDSDLDLTYPPYVAKYTPLFRRTYGTDVLPEEFVRQWSQVIRVTPTNFRHDA